MGGARKWLSVRCQYQKGDLEVWVSNSQSLGNRKKGVGGIGLDNLKRRLALLYPDQHLLDIKVKEDVFTVHLNVNLYEN